MIPNEKAVICKNLVCYALHILFVYVLTAYGCTRLRKTRKLEYTNRVNFRHHCLSCGDIIDTSLQSFTLFIKYTLADIIILWLLKIRYYNANSNKDNIQFVTEFPCFFGHLVLCTLSKFDDTKRKLTQYSLLLLIHSLSFSLTIVNQDYF